MRGGGAARRDQSGLETVYSTGLICGRGTDIETLPTLRPGEPGSAPTSCPGGNLAAGSSSPPPPGRAGERWRRQEERPSGEVACVKRVDRRRVASGERAAGTR